VATRVSTGSLGEIALDGHGDGVAASTDLAPQGDSIRNRVIRVTRIRDGRPLRTRSVARSDYDVIYLDAGLTPAARGIVTYEEPIARRIMVVTGR
jgi:hypothetical protein